MWTLFAISAFAFIELRANKYGWMQRMDLDLALTLPPDPTSGGHTIFVLLFLATIVTSQLAITSAAANRREKVWAITLAIVAVAL